MRVGDRVRITRNYLKGILYVPVRGKTGTVIAITKRHVDVRMDVAADGIQDYLYLPDEVEVI